MKKLLLSLFLFLGIAASAGCTVNKKVEIRITVPAGSTAEYVYSDETVSPTGNTIKITSGENLGETEVILLNSQGETNEASIPVYMEKTVPAEIPAEKGRWYRIGVSVRNPSQEDIVISVFAEHATVAVE